MRYTRMPKDFHGFAEKAIEIAGEAGEKKRKHALIMKEKDIAAQLAGIERAESGATKRRIMMETGLGTRLGRTQEFARPTQTAEIERLKSLKALRGAETEKVKYGTEFEKGLEGTLRDIVKTKGRLGVATAEEAELGLSEERRRLGLRDIAETEAARIQPPGAKIAASPARAGREINPALRRALFGGPLAKRPAIAPSPLFAPEEGWGETYESFLGRPLKQTYEWAFPRTK